MSLDIGPIGRVTYGGASDPSPPRAPVAADAVELSSGEIPAGPPPEVLDAVGAAARAYEELHAHGRELRFDLDESSNRVIVQVCDLDGNVLRTIPPSEALDLAAGAPLG